MYYNKMKQQINNLFRLPKRKIKKSTLPNVTPIFLFFAGRRVNFLRSYGLRIPFANASDVVVDANSARELGHDLAKAIRVYLENSN